MKTRNQILVELRRQKKRVEKYKEQLKELEQIKSLLGSKEQTKFKITLEQIVYYMGIRLKYDKDISIRDIPLCDFQVYITRKIKNI